MTALYRHYDADGVLLYVGISRSVTARLAQHADSPWDHLIARVEVERFATREEAEEAEREAIKNERPIYNRTHNGRWLAPAEVPDGEYSLADYLKAAGMNQTDFAALVPTNQANICRWCAGLIPKPQFIKRIDELTEGKVPPAVWFRRDAAA